MAELDEASLDALTRMLLQRDLAAAARHALEMEHAADEVTITATFNKHGLALDIEYQANGLPLSGWGV